MHDAPFAVNSDFNLNHWSLGQNLRALSVFRRTLREFKPNILNPHCPPGHSYLAVARAMEGISAPLIRTVADPRPPRMNPINTYLHHRRTDGIIFTTDSSRLRYGRRLRLDVSRVRTILPGFRADEFAHGAPAASYRVRFNLNKDQLLAGIIARMSPEKGQEVLLHALSLLSDADRRRIFCIISGEDTRERGQRDLAELADKLGVTRLIAFAPRLDDVRGLMAELDLAVITSTRSEAICRIALEYMSLGVPVIASDVNILPEVIHDGANGWTFPNHDAHALAACLHHALNNPEERHRRGHNGFDAVRTLFHLDRELDETLDFYNRLLLSSSPVR
jgi:glycosyltransferase involved in cell wall biosynthesis